MIRQSLLLVAALAACKGETKSVDNPETKKALDECTAARAEKESLNAKLLDENAKLLKGNTAGATTELTITVQGDVLTVKPGGNGGAPQPNVDNKANIALTGQFIDIVRKSRGAFQKCYEGVLKKHPELGQHSTMLTVQASFAQDGLYKSATFAPQLDATFDNCVHGIATHWALPAGSPPVNLQAPIELKPS